MGDARDEEVPCLAIIGGGLGGVVLSIALTHHGVRHKVYESAKAFSEIGKGIACAPNTVTALRLIDPRLGEAYDRCATYNESPGLRKTWFTYYYEMEEDDPGGIKSGDPITRVEALPQHDYGRSAMHRARFLDEAIRLVPPGITEFNKHLESLRPEDDGVRLHFADGTEVLASAVIGCDGIKSVVRQHLLEKIAPEAVSPVYSGGYAYRALVSRAVADEVLGRERAGNGQIWCGRGGYIVMYPVDHGTSLNIVACPHRPLSPWPPSRPWLHPVPSTTMHADFASWSRLTHTILSHMSPIEQWAIFDAPDAPTFAEGLVCVLGDAAHASTPHQGAGAGMAFEDAYVLGGLVREAYRESSVSPGSSGGSHPDTVKPTIPMATRLKAAFQSYSNVRLPRTQKLVRTSRHCMEVYALCAEGVEEDLGKVAENLKQRHNWIWGVDLERDLEEGLGRMRDLLGAGSAGGG